MITLRLQEILQERGISQRALSDLSGVRQTRISQMCRNYVDRLELDHVDAICTALGVRPWEWIVYYSPEDIEGGISDSEAEGLQKVLSKLDSNKDTES